MYLHYVINLVYSMVFTGRYSYIYYLKLNTQTKKRKKNHRWHHNYK